MEKYDEFFKKVKGFLEQAEKHKRRGNNDFNPYLQMWSESNEVKLHSALICGFLDPLGNHYQGDVFLETFLECVGLREWFDDTSNARVHQESQYIDVYITNGEKHIIIENKINAGDQDRQIERYIETIAKEQSKDSNDDMESGESETPQEQSASYDNIAVLYLVPYKRNPSKSSLGKWQIDGEYLIDKKNRNNQVRFKAITYKNEILKWIENSQAKIGCITHLNSALYFYKDVVQIITNTKENTMSVAKFLTEKNMEENMEIVFEILKSKDKIIESYCKAIIEEYREQIESKGFEIVKTSKNKKMGNWGKNDLSYPLMIKPKDCGKYYFAFCVEHYIRKEKYNCYGVRIFEQNLNDNLDDNISSKIIDYLNVKFIWWLNYDKNFWWYAFDTSIAELESNLRKFLDSAEIKTLNEKLKSYQT